MRLPNVGWMDGEEDLNIQSGNERNKSKDKHWSIKQNAMGTFTHGVGVLQLLHYYWIQPKAENLLPDVGWNHTLWDVFNAKSIICCHFQGIEGSFNNTLG
jgi:hypothetical protein